MKQILYIGVLQHVNFPGEISFLELRESFQSHSCYRTDFQDVSLIFPFQRTLLLDLNFSFVLKKIKLITGDPESIEKWIKENIK